MEERDIPLRLRDLALRAKKSGVFTFSPFLAPEDAAFALNLDGNAIAFGGTDFAERQMVRFGEDGCLGTGDFPLSIVAIRPKNPKFGFPMTHRDYLGALLGLGIEREHVGDIYPLGCEAYAVIDAGLAPFVCEELCRVGSVAVVCEPCEGVPAECAPKRECVTVIVASKRLDAILSHVWHLSREDGAALLAKGRVSLRGQEVQKGTYQPKEGEVFSVKGYGKFCYVGEIGTTKKGRLMLRVDVYK